jgi:negative regulator of flagellin synthesis FlgM
MKISNANPNSVASTKISGQSSLEQQKIDNKRDATAGTIGSSAQVEVSEGARQIQKAMDLAKVDDGVDAEKVARLQQLIDSGNYKVDAQAIADRLVDEHFKMPT